MSNWQLVSFGDVVDFQTGYPFKSTEYSSVDNDPKLLRGDNIGQGALRWDGVKRWPVAKTEGVEEYRLQPGDVVLAMDRPWIEAGLKFAAVSATDTPCFLVQRVARLRGTHKVLNRFVRYIVSSAAFTEYVLGVQTGTAVPHISGGQIKNYKFFLPPVRLQERISEVLGSLDDKIELNRRMNETLEAMARAIFRDWFIDFGPTRRKLEGATDPIIIMGGLVQDTGRAHALADLFPAALGDDGLPEGWTFVRLEDVLELAYGKALPKGERRDGTIPVYGSGGVGGFHDIALVSGPSVIVGRKGTVGSLYWEDDDFYPIDTAFYVKSKLPMTYCYQLLQTLGLETMNTDAAVPGLNRNNAYRLEVPQPHNSKLMSEFSKIANVLRSKITGNIRENRTLAATRGLLLPKLMSGEVRLSAASEAAA